MYTYVAFLALLQSPSQHAGVPLVEDCSDSSPALANLAPDARIDVRSSVSGYEKACYAVTAVVDGKPVKGYVLGQGLSAIADFERKRAERDAALVMAPPVATPEEAAKAAAPAAPVEKPHYPPFRDFSATDTKGRAVSARSLKGKVNLVCFWSPTSKKSFADILAVIRLYGQFKDKGVDAVSLSLSGNTSAFRDTLDDIHPGFRTVPNGLDIAASYGISYDNLPRIYVLNENSEVIASGLHGKAVEDLVKKLIAEK